jgi:hypothetical protein
MRHLVCASECKSVLLLHCCANTHSLSHALTLTCAYMHTKHTHSHTHIYNRNIAVSILFPHDMVSDTATSALLL